MRSALPRRALKGKTFPTVHNDSLAVVKRRQVNETPKTRFTVKTISEWNDLAPTTPKKRLPSTIHPAEGTYFCVLTLRVA
jgi:hypothetical protein